MTQARFTPAVWFHDAGFHVFPTINKVPIVPKGTSWKDYRCSRAEAARFREYAVPLGLLAVVDTDAPDVEAWVAAHVADTPFKVTTGRGRHRYYRLVSEAPHFIHRDSHTIEFRHRGAYVVGPSSIRPDGVVYVAEDWSWNVDDIPFFPVRDFCFDDGTCGRFSAPGEPYEFPEVVRAGERHNQLFRLLRSCKGKGWERGETRKLVTLANENRCAPPLTEDRTFEQWFDRQWRKPDRPLDPFAVNLEAF